MAVGFTSSGFNGQPVVTFNANTISVNIAGDLLNPGSSFTITPIVTTVTLIPAGPFLFTQAAGGPSPASQSLVLSAFPGSATYSAQVSPITGGNWALINSASSSSGSLQPFQNLSLTVDPRVANTLPPGQYTSQINLSFPGLRVAPNNTVTVNLSVVGRALSVSAPSFYFAYDPSVPPTSQALTVTSAGGSVNFSVATTSLGDWLTTDTSSASTPQTVHIGIDASKLPASFPAGTQLTGTVTIAAPLAQPSSIAIPVTLTSAVPSAPQPSLIMNGYQSWF